MTKEPIHIHEPTIPEFEWLMQEASRMELDLSGIERNQCVISSNNIGETTGFVRLVKKSDCTELATLGVVRQHRGKQIGSELIKYFQRKHPELYLVTVIPEYFQKLGFEFVEVFPESLEKKLNNKILWEGYGIPVVMKYQAQNTNTENEIE